jgi:hypothetical protein
VSGPVLPPDQPCLRECDCGEWHVLRPEAALAIDVFGPTVTMVTGQGAWEVPRVYAEFHHPETAELPLLATVHEWAPWNPA